MVNRVRFLHLADLHIGLQPGGFDEKTAGRIRETRFQALDNALILAEKSGVDFIVIAGDLFDHNGVAREDAERVFDNLKRKPMPVYVLPGNHDPFRPGSVWDRAPWNQWRGTSIVLLDQREPLAVRDGLTLFPATVFSRNCIQDPTEWIGQHQRRNDGIRLAIAHGSIHDRETLSHDDHLIDRNRAEKSDLDFVALGHWHSFKEYRGTGGQTRMAYPGTHEQMNFPRGDGPDDDFRGGSEGQALLVEIDRDGGQSAVTVTREKVGCLVWEDRPHNNVDDDKLGEIISGIGRESDVDRRVLRLRLRGAVSLEGGRVGLSALRTMVANRFLHADLDLSELITRPGPGEVQAALGDGMWQKVYQQLSAAGEGAPESSRAVLSECVLVLYQLAREVEK